MAELAAPSARTRTPLRELAVGNLGAALLGLLVGRLDSALAPLAAPGTPWLLAGLTLAIVLRLGPGCWPGVLLGTAAAAWSLNPAPAAALALGAFHVLAVVGTAWLVRRRAVDPDLERGHDLGWLVAAAALVGAPVLAASQWAVAWLIPGANLSAPALALAWPWHTLGLLVAAVAALTLTRPRRDAGQDRARAAWAVAGSLLTVAVTVAYTFWAPPFGWPRQWLAWWPHVLLVLLVLRCGPTAASVTLLFATLSAALATAQGLGPFHAPGLLLPTLGLCLYLGSLLIPVVAAQAAIGLHAHRARRSSLALDHARLGVAEWHVSRPWDHYRSRGWRLLGSAPGESHWSPSSWLADVHDSDRKRLQDALEEVHAGARRELLDEVRLRDAEGWHWVEVRVHATERDAAGKPRRMLATMAEVSERREALERQRLSASLFEHLHEGLLITDADLRVLDANPAYSAILGVPLAELRGSVPNLLRPQPKDPLARQQRDRMWAALREWGRWRGELIEQRRDGQACTLLATVSQVHGPDGALRYHVLAIADVTEQRQARERLERQAHFDELTRLPNRVRLTEMLADAMRAADRDQGLLVVCYMDLDRFKPVNDRHGHAAGDRLLVELAGRLRGALRSRDLWADAAARLGGDEFVLLLRAHTLEEARLAVERVLRVVGQPFVVDAEHEPVQVTASVGATVYPIDRSDADTLLRHADHAMYGAKQSGRNGYLFFDPELRRRTEERVMAIGRVQEALDRAEFVLHYQPIVDMRRNRVTAFEALLRWDHPEQGLIAPMRFLPLIEHTGLSARIGDWVISQALEHLAHWRREGLDIAVSVNISARHLQEPDFVQRLRELLARHPQPLAESLKLEIVESAAHQDIDVTSELLARCRDLGVRSAIDDFGTAYSTLTNLRRLPVDLLKIDRSFITHMLDDDQDRAIVVGVIGLAKSLGCAVIAEGVETPAQARALLELGCDLGQGTGISVPLPASEVAGWARQYGGLFTLSAAAAAPRGAANWP